MSYSRSASPSEDVSNNCRSENLIALQFDSCLFSADERKTGTERWRQKNKGCESSRVRSQVSHLFNQRKTICFSR